MAFFGSLFFTFLNLGLVLGAVMGVLILLRPVTNRLLAPRQRVALWGAGWFLGFGAFMAYVARLPLPFPTFPDLLISRAENGWPMILPRLAQEGGDYFLALPGGSAVPFSLPGWAVSALGWVGVLYAAASLGLCVWQDVRVRRLRRAGEPLDPAGYDGLGAVRDQDLKVLLCPGLPTSYVIRTGLGRHEIVLQKELPPEQMRLVFLHERAHTARHDPWLQSLMTMVLAFHFWNPILWAACYFTRRDMELACDQKVLEQLSEEDRRAYARTLVELASDKPVWGGVTCFGECDASVRVRAAARWEPRGDEEDFGPKVIFGWMLVIALAVFLMLGEPWDKALRADILQEMDQLGVWERAAQELTWDEGTTFYAKGDGAFASVKFQGPDGTWQQIHYRRYESDRFGIEVHCGVGTSAPDGEYMVLIPGGESE